MSERQPYVTPSSVFDRAEELLLSSVPSVQIHVYKKMAM
jgi:hypothetical protein